MKLQVQEVLRATDKSYLMKSKLCWPLCNPEVQTFLSAICWLIPHLYSHTVPAPRGYLRGLGAPVVGTSKLKAQWALLRCLLA